MEDKSSKNGIKLIAELAGVSIGTVDRVLHNRPGVNKETKEKVLRIIKELNYQPNILARRLVSKKKFRFAILIPFASNGNTFWTSHQKGIERAETEISQYGITIDKLLYDQNNPASFTENVKKVEEGNYDGVLVVPFYSSETHQLLTSCKERQIPYVFIDTNLPTGSAEPLSFVGQNASKSGYFAGKFFSYLVRPEDTVLVVSINATKIADNHVNYLQREEGFKKFVSESGKFKIQLFNFNNPDEQLLEKELLQTLNSSTNIKGIFVTNSRAYLVADILEKHNLKTYRLLGYDLTVPNIGHLNKEVIDFLISQDPTNQGYLGVQMLYKKLILNEEVPTEHYMPLDLISKENLEYYGR